MKKESKNMSKGVRMRKKGKKYLQKKRKGANNDNARRMSARKRFIYYDE